MIKRVNVTLESELYPSMRLWLEHYLTDHYKGYSITVIDTHNKALDTSLREIGIICDEAVGLGIQIDILGIAISKRKQKLFFIEAKKTNLTIRDLGQLLIYCKLINPDEAFLLTSAGLGSLDKLLNVYKREDLLNFGDNKALKLIRVSEWDIDKNTPIWNTMIPPV